MKYEAKLIASSIIIAAGIIGLSMPESLNGYECIGVMAVVIGAILFILAWAEIDLNKIFMGNEEEGKQGLLKWVKNYDKLENRMAKEDEEESKPTKS